MNASNAALPDLLRRGLSLLRGRKVSNSTQRHSMVFCFCMCFDAAHIQFGRISAMQHWNSRSRRDPPVSLICNTGGKKTTHSSPASHTLPLLLLVQKDNKLAHNTLWCKTTTLWCRKVNTCLIRTLPLLQVTRIECVVQKRFQGGQG